jgi:hypothetical protein
MLTYADLCDVQRYNLPTVVCLSEHDEIGPALAVEKHIAQHAAATAAIQV